jgi:gliding motility-associated-like protein
VGSYVIVASGLTAGNYSISYVDGSLTIDKAMLTVTANDVTKTYDGVAYAGGNGVSYSGFVHGETAGVLTGSVSYSGSSQGAVNTGQYDIIPSGYLSDNYMISYTNGKLMIEKATLTITADSQARCYGINNPNFTMNYSGWVNGEGTGVLSAQASVTTTATVNSVAGTYSIVPGGAVADNYTIIYANGVLTIYALPEITLTAANGSILCGNNASITLAASGNYSYQWLQDNTSIPGVNTGTLVVSTKGVYTAVGTDVHGCIANADNSITVTSIMPATAAFNYDSYCAGKEVIFTNASDIRNSGDVTYKWMSGDGQTSDRKDATFTYLMAGDYVAALTITPNSCPSLATTITRDVNIAAQIDGVRLTDVTTTAGLATQLTARELTGALYTWTPANGLSDASIYNPVAKLEGGQEYLIRMEFASGCNTVDTLRVNTTVGYDMMAANAFTPNGDGQNDVFRVHLKGVKQFIYLMIYDRWGNKIFETKDPAIGWDGRFSGVLQEVGTYIWSAEAIDVNGNTMHRQGVVILVK